MNTTIQEVKNYRVVDREQVANDIQTLDRVSLAEHPAAADWRDRPRSLDNVLVALRHDYVYGVIDFECLAYGAKCCDARWFPDARNVEEAIALWVKDQKRFMDELARDEEQQ